MVENEVNFYVGEDDGGVAEAAMNSLLGILNIPSSSILKVPISFLYAATQPQHQAVYPPACCPVCIILLRIVQNNCGSP